MSAKKNTTTPASSDNLPALKIGSRVRCTDDGMMGKIAWANGVSVKIKWDDGEQVTWRRDELPGKPIEIFQADDEPRNEQPAPETEATTAEADPVTELVAATEQAEPTTETVPTTSEQEIAVEPRATDATTIAAEPQVTEAVIAVPEQSAATPTTEQVATTPEPTEVTTPALSVYSPETAAPAKPKRERKAKTSAEPKEKKVSALDAAARVLNEAGTAMTCKDMIGVMAAKGYWSSPGGRTPDATLCAAILTEIKKKGEQSRFIKTAPGRFSARPTV